jgi:hypothetical protein
MDLGIVVFNGHEHTTETDLTLKQFFHWKQQTQPMPLPGDSHRKLLRQNQLTPKLYSVVVSHEAIVLPVPKVVVDVLTWGNRRKVCIQFTSYAPIGWIVSHVTNPIKCRANQAIGAQCPVSPLPLDTADWRMPVSS